MRQICMSGSMSGVWKRSHGRTSEAPPDERGGNSYARPTATAPHSDSTGPAGLFLANVMVLLFSWVSGDQFLAWGWRVPFWLSIVMVGIGLYIRLGILETPVFARLLENRRVERMPVIEVIKRQPKQIILTALARMAEQGPFYVYAAFLFTYGTTVLHSSRDLLLSALLTATGLSAITIPLSGYISDRIGRKRMYLIGA